MGRQFGEEPLAPTQCWMDMMGNALAAAEVWLTHPHALYLEFGVASGRSLAPPRPYTPGYIVINEYDPNPHFLMPHCHSPDLDWCFPNSAIS